MDGCQYDGCITCDLDISHNTEECEEVISV